MLQIKVLGSGCTNCKKVEGNAQKAVTDMGMQAEIIKVQDYNEILDYNVMSTPGLVINEKVVSSGRIPTPAEICTWLADAVAEVN